MKTNFKYHDSLQFAPWMWAIWLSFPNQILCIFLSCLERQPTFREQLFQHLLKLNTDKTYGTNEIHGTAYILIYIVPVRAWDPYCFTVSNHWMTQTRQRQIHKCVNVIIYIYIYIYISYLYICLIAIQPLLYQCLLHL